MMPELDTGETRQGFRSCIHALERVHRRGEPCQVPFGEDELTRLASGVPIWERHPRSHIIDQHDALIARHEHRVKAICQMRGIEY